MEIQLAVVFVVQQFLQYLRVVITGIRRRGGDRVPGVDIVGPVVRQ